MGETEKMSAPPLEAPAVPSSNGHSANGTNTTEYPIVVEKLSKTYKVSDREGGFGASVRGFFQRKYTDVQAVRDVSFRIGAGEIVGLFGSERGRQDDDAENALRAFAPDQRDCPGARLYAVAAKQ
jgi:ABC-type glutathione transport system ATPase component